MTMVMSWRFSQAGMRHSRLTSRWVAPAADIIGQMAHQARPAKKNDRTSIGHQTDHTRSVPRFPRGPAGTNQHW